MVKRRRCKLCRKLRKIQFFDNADKLTNICKACCKEALFHQLDVKRRWRERVKTHFHRIMEGKSVRECGFIDHFMTMKIRSHKYFRMDRYFTAEECDEMKNCKSLSDLPFEPIIFGDQDINRYQKTIFKFRNTHKTLATSVPDCVRNFIELFCELHPNTTHMTWKIIHSDPQSKSQPIHVDDKEMTTAVGNKKHEFASFSIVISLEPDENRTELLLALGTERPFPILTERIFQGSLLLFRGDMPHAGGAYQDSNTRCFVAIGTAEFTHSGRNVGLV